MIRYLLLIYALAELLFAAPTLRPMDQIIDHRNGSTSDSQAQEIAAAVNAVMLKVVIVTAICTVLLAILMTMLFLKIKQKIAQLHSHMNPTATESDLEAGNLKILEEKFRQMNEASTKVNTVVQKHEGQDLQRIETPVQKQSTVTEKVAQKKRRSRSVREKQTTLKVCMWF